MAAALSTISLRFSDTASSKKGPVPSVRTEREKKRLSSNFWKRRCVFVKALGLFLCADAAGRYKNLERERDKSEKNPPMLDEVRLKINLLSFSVKNGLK